MEFGIGLMNYPGCWDDVALAEEHGFGLAGFVESPVITLDPYACMALAAKQTTKIRLGASLTVPGLRTTLVAAAGLATVNTLAPGRVWAGVGTGHSARQALGLKALSAQKMADYANDLRTLLAGEEIIHRTGTAERGVRMHSRGHLPIGPDAPAVPVYLAANGPKALQAAAQHGDGVLAGTVTGSAMGNSPEVFAETLETLRGIREANGRSLDDFFTIYPPTICVLEEGESAISERALRQAGPLSCLQFHLYALDPNIGQFLPPASQERLEIFDREVLPHLKISREKLYQEINQGHLEFLLDGEAKVLTEEIIKTSTLTGTPEEIAAQLHRFEQAGLDCAYFCVPSTEVRDVIVDVAEKVMPLMTPAADPVPA